MSERIAVGLVVAAIFGCATMILSVAARFDEWLPGGVVTFVVTFVTWMLLTRGRR